ncbi:MULTISPECIES: ABC transporter permease [Exiguobacterium]|uniref:ABC transporter permease n=1 Tax=Exiguobacterium TaxID=33986 RepID=UPI001BE52DAD|nr:MULTISPECIES: ABC transporter permease [Exiguobacterium]MCT4782114.1 ABC transporter permease [Exiguobacterium himgiriensis]
MKQLMQRELTNIWTVRSLLVYATIIFIVPLVQFMTIREQYQFFEPIEVFEESVSTIPAMLFPVLAVLVFLPNILAEHRHHFMTYTRTRVELSTYLLVKGIVNAVLSGIVLFLMIFVTFLFVYYIEPMLHLVTYTDVIEGEIVPQTTLSFLADIHPFLYGFFHAVWIGMNGALYATMAYLLMLMLENVFVAISLPFLSYHILNFVAGIFQSPQFSPLSTLFPFNISAQPVWTMFVPFFIFLSLVTGLYVFGLRRRREWSF